VADQKSVKIECWHPCERAPLRSLCQDIRGKSGLQALVKSLSFAAHFSLGFAIRKRVFTAAKRTRCVGMNLLMLMFRFRKYTALLIAILATAVTASSDDLRADDFRVETQVHRGEEAKAISSNTTLFCAGAIYDFPSNGDQVTIFDPKDSRIVLLDTKRRLRTELTVDQVLDFSQRLRDWAQTQDDPLLRFAIEPRFEQDFDSESRRMRFSSRWISYEVKTLPAASQGVADQYRMFCDVYAHLNALTNPAGSVPPFARIEVNRQLAQVGNLPAEIHLTIPSRSGGPEVKMSTRHRYHESLSKGDLSQVDKAALHNANFRTVNLRAYRGLDMANARR